MQRKATVATAGGVAAIFAIGWADHVTGPDIGFSLFYLVPIAVVGWFGGSVPSVLVAVAAAASSQWADVVWRTGGDLGVVFWNGFTRLIIYVTYGALVGVVRADRDRLRRIAAHESALARTDHATQMPNTRAFLELLDVELDYARSHPLPLCLLYIDLDRFKSINDRFGHVKGDEVLQRVGEAIAASIRGNDIAARIGGDEFAVLLKDVGTDGAERVASRIFDRVVKIAVEFPGIGFGVTIGAVYCDTPPESAGELIRLGDAAMYEGKKTGRACVIVHTHEAAALQKV